MATTNLRRSSRLQSSAPTQQPSVGASSSNPPKRPAKRQRVAKDDTETKAVSRSKRVTKKQVLRQMLDMPLDILYEVSSLDTFLGDILHEQNKMLGDGASRATRPPEARTDD